MLTINHKEHIVSNSIAINLIEEQRYQIRKAFEHGEPLQYRPKFDKDTGWANAHWCSWDWDRYEYRIKPKEKEKIEAFVPIYPYLVNGAVVWNTEERATYKQSMNPDVEFVRVIRFRTIKGVRNAVIEKEV